MIGDLEPTMVRTYRGKGGMADYRADAEMLARKGYVAASTVQTPGGRTPAATLFVVLGVICLVGGLAFFPLWAVAVVCLVIGLVSGKGSGELTVTWVRR